MKFRTLIVLVMVVAIAGLAHALTDRHNVLHTGDHNFEGALQIDGTDIVSGNGIDGETIADDSIDRDSLDDEDITGVAAGAAVSGLATATERWGSVRTVVLALTVDGATALSLPDGDHGDGTNVYNITEGRIAIIGAAINAYVTVGTNFNATADDEFYVGIGTAEAGDDNTLSSTEQDIIAVKTCDTASGTTSNFTWQADLTIGGDLMFDGTSTAVGIWVNSCVADSDNGSSAANPVSVTGTLAIAYMWLLDD